MQYEIETPDRFITRKMYFSRRILIQNLINGNIRLNIIKKLTEYINHF